MFRPGMRKSHTNRVDVPDIDSDVFEEAAALHQHRRDVQRRPNSPAASGSSREIRRQRLEVDMRGRSDQTADRRQLRQDAHLRRHPLGEQIEKKVRRVDRPTSVCCGGHE